jgi:hypothetical protein
VYKTWMTNDVNVNIVGHVNGGVWFGVTLTQNSNIVRLYEESPV